MAYALINLVFKCFHVKCLSIIIPRYLVQSFFGICLLFISREILGNVFCGGENRMKEDFETFRESLLADSQVETELNSLFTLLLISVTFLFE